MELYKRYRPKKLAKILGQESAVKILQSFIKKKRIPHVLLLSGPSGCGKTTIARIMRRKLKCGKHDFMELDCADFRGIEMVRTIRLNINKAPISGKRRVWLIDECHKLTTDAQNAFLKMLEDTPKHVYFILATTEPQKVMKTIRTRSTEIVVKNLTDKNLTKLVISVYDKENQKPFQEVVDKIVECSDGSARKALVLLNQTIILDNKNDMLDAIESTTAEVQGIAIARALFNPKIVWHNMAKVLKETSNEEPETIRRIVLGYAKTILLSGSKLSSRAYLIIDVFADNFFNSGHAGLAAACYEIVVGIEN